MTTSISPARTNPAGRARTGSEPTVPPVRFAPVVDVAEDSRCVTIRALLPGIGVRDVVVGLDHDRVVLRGALRGNGMPPFEGMLTPAEVASVRAYVVTEAHKAYEKQQAPQN